MWKSVSVCLGVALWATAAGAANSEQRCTDATDYDAVVIACGEAIRDNASNTDALSHRGLAFLENDEYDRAIADFAQIIAIIPEEPHAYHHRGLAHFMKGDYEPRRRRSHRGDQASAGALFSDHRGRAYRMQGDVDRPSPTIPRPSASCPDNDLYYAERSHDHLAKKQYARALADIAEAIKLDPADDSHLAARSRIHLGDGRPSGGPSPT